MHNEALQTKEVWGCSFDLGSQYLCSFVLLFPILNSIESYLLTSWLILKALYCARQYKHKQQTHYREQDDFSHYLSSFWIHTPTRVLIQAIERMNFLISIALFPLRE